MAEQSLPIHSENNIHVLPYATAILNGMEVEDITQQLHDYIEANPGAKLIMDLTDVDFLSSAALGMLLKTQNHLAESGGKLRLAGAQRRIKELLHITALDSKFKTCSTVESAVEDLS